MRARPRCLVVVAALAACAGACSRRQEPLATPPGPPAAESAAADGGEDPIPRCAAALREMADDRCDPLQKLRGYYLACAPVYRQAACRQGFVDAASPALGAQGINVVQQACAEAYCPLLAEPKPAMCAMDPQKIRLLRMAEKGQRWGELERAILVHDRGPDAVERLGRGVKAPDLRTVVRLEREGRAQVRHMGGFADVALARPEDERGFVEALRERGANGGVVLEPGEATPAERVAYVRAVMVDAGIAEIETRKPCPPSLLTADRGTSAGSLGLTVRITEDGAWVATAAGPYGAGCKAGAGGATVPRKGGRIEMGPLAACARQIKHAKPEHAAEKGVVLTASPGIPYREVIDAMDALRGEPPDELFPEVTFGAPR